jgi:hypothetical protein
VSSQGGGVLPLVFPLQTLAVALEVVAALDGVLEEVDRGEQVSVAVIEAARVG